MLIIYGLLDRNIYTHLTKIMEIPLFHDINDYEFLLTTSKLERYKSLLELNEQTTEFDFNSFPIQNIHTMIMIITLIFIKTFTIQLM